MRVAIACAEDGHVRVDSATDGDRREDKLGFVRCSDLDDEGVELRAAMSEGLEMFKPQRNVRMVIDAVGLRIDEGEVLKAGPCVDQIEEDGRGDEGSQLVYVEVQSMDVAEGREGVDVGWYARGGPKPLCDSDSEGGEVVEGKEGHARERSVGENEEPEGLEE